jgi:hypothetical protein
VPVKLIFYSLGHGEVRLRPAEATRTWMDETQDAFAYRCLPLNIANAHGWEVLAPCGFSARWNGGQASSALDIRCAAGSNLRPTSIFGNGVVTFHLHGLFRTEPGWNLFVGGSPNRPKDGIYPLSGVIETDWAPYSFTMNWKFTRADHWVSFDEGEPFCFVYPVQRGVLEAMEPEIREIGSEPALQADHSKWSAERTYFNDQLTVKDTAEARMRWQKRYYRGLTMQGEPGIPDHQAKLRLPEFADQRAPDPAAEAARRHPLPEFFHKVVALSRVKHAALGLRKDSYGFAATTALIPLAGVELVHAAADYPIAFSDTNPPRPVCVMGGLPGINLHVDAAGAWRAGHYIPAAVRRFPFITMMSRDKPDILTLGIEEASALLDAAAPDKLFAADGEMTPLCRERLGFAASLAAEFEKTEALCDKLPGELLMPARNVAPGRFASRSITRELRVVDPERLRALPEALRAEWQANGWLAALEAQIASARNWPRLLALEDEMSVAATRPRGPT